MKKTIIAAMLLTATAMVAKDIKTLVVTTQPQMHCENCEKKIKGNLRFERGVKLIDTNREQQRVTITYDAEKTTPAQLLKSFTRFGYKATEVNDSLQQKPARQ